MAVRSRLAFCFAVCFVVLGLGLDANAELITVNFNPNNSVAAGAPISGPAGASQFWTNDTTAGNFNPPSGASLVNSDGMATAVGYQFNLPYNDPWGSTLPMLHGAVYTPGWSDWGLCKITGLTACWRTTKYDRLATV